jgi:thiol:disulfide interchange protein
MPEPDLTSRITTAAMPARRSWRGSIVWAAILAVIVLLYWPMLKGMYYRVAGAPASEDGINWRTDYDAALAESRASGKPVLLDFSATWCPPCQVMKHEAWPDAQVRDLANGKYIPVALDVDLSASRRPAEKYNITTIPAIVIVDGNGNVVRSGSFMDKSELAQFLQRSSG